MSIYLLKLIINYIYNKKNIVSRETITTIGALLAKI